MPSQEASYPVLFSYKDEHTRGEGHTNIQWNPYKHRGSLQIQIFFPFPFCHKGEKGEVFFFFPQIQKPIANKKREPTKRE